MWKLLPVAAIVYFQRGRRQVVVQVGFGEGLAASRGWRVEAKHGSSCHRGTEVYWSTGGGKERCRCGGGRNLNARARGSFGGRCGCPSLVGRTKFCQISRSARALGINFLRASK
ncbi:Uncharacterized protein Adt_01633 [Abeliophyllum distichum]|uniref:Secreted protein n=1 Tax=Abeliophyllum distichum TaxID=126358 RepID=A0ABD1VTM4_9LAMI